MSEKVLTTLGMKCPRPLFELHRFIKELAPGDSVRVMADDPAFRLDIEAWCRRTGHALIDVTQDGARLSALVRKAA